MSRDATSTSGFWRTQLTTFAVLFAGYASYTYNRKSGTKIDYIYIMGVPNISFLASLVCLT